MLATVRGKKNSNGYFRLPKKLYVLLPIKKICGWVVVVQAFNPSTWEAEAGGSQ